jgi:hypothetical protein
MPTLVISVYSLHRLKVKSEHSSKYGWAHRSFI